MGKLFRDETGQDIARYLGIIAGDHMSSLLTNWDAVGMIASDGNADKILKVGDTITEPWKDGADSYDNPWRVDHFCDEEDQEGRTIHGVWLATEYTHPFGVQFSHQRAFLACPDGLGAGTYHFTFGDNWGTNVVKGKSYQFTITKAVPEGGRLAGCYGAPDQAPANWRVYSYGADGIQLNETVTITEGTGGTDLGTMQATKRDGNLNCFQEMAYGHNRWKTSALRQYLNSDATKGNWWTAQDQWDIAPDQLATKDGFLCGMDPEMRRNIATVKVTTYANTVNDEGTADVTYDKVILPSLEQMYINPQIAGEGEAHEYWKELNGTATKWQQWQTYPILRQYIVTNHTSPQYVRLRSASRGYACYTWHVFASGYVNYSNASNAYVFAPLVFVHH